MEDSQFPLLKEGFPEAVQFTSLWAIKDLAWITETIFLGLDGIESLYGY